jgi:hypothetical protein
VRPSRRRLHPEPRLVVEVLSPSTERYPSSEWHLASQLVVSAARGCRLLADSHERRYFVVAKAPGDAAAASRLHLPGTFLLGVVTLSR